jgi:hypothetical protein
MKLEGLAGSLDHIDIMDPVNIDPRDRLLSFERCQFLNRELPLLDMMLIVIDDAEMDPLLFFLRRCRPGYPVGGRPYATSAECSQEENMRMVLSRFRRSQETIIKWSRFTFLMFSPDHLAAVIDDIIEMQHPRDLLFEPQATMADRLRNLFNAIAEHQGDWIAVLYESDFRNSVQGKKGTIYGTIGCYTDFFLDPITDDNSDVVGEETRT